MASAPKKKNQHYVPRTLLRRFSPNGRSIGLIVLKTGRRISGASIGDQCSRNCFYGEDGTVEDGLAVVEENFSRALGDLSASHLEALTTEDEMHIVFFTHLQRSRTVAAAATISDVGDGMMRRVLERRAKASGIDLDLVRFEQPHPQLIALAHAFETGPLLFDLELKFLLATKKPKFVISDDPVAVYNQWAEHHPRFRTYPATTGTALKGLQIFLPVSPEVCVALYDPSTYEYGSTTSRICTPSVRDIRALNDLQGMNARVSGALKLIQSGGLKLIHPWLFIEPSVS